MAIARAIHEGELEYSSEMVERIFGCFMCARCTEECKKAAQIDVVAITKTMREDIVSLGVGIPEAGARMVSMTLETGNIFADTPAGHTKWAARQMRRRRWSRYSSKRYRTEESLK
jgi:heterodisulfide reductase subunit C